MHAPDYLVLASQELPLHIHSEFSPMGKRRVLTSSLEEFPVFTIRHQISKSSSHAKNDRSPLLINFKTKAKVSQRIFGF
jgi:hypothetical protein